MGHPEIVGWAADQRRRDDLMAGMSRRTVVGRGAIALAASLTAVGSSKPAEAVTMTAGFFHVFAFQWKPGTTPEQIEKARRAIAAFQGVIPGLVATHVGQNLSEKGKGYTFGGVMEFADTASFEAYPGHPAHQALLVWLRPLIDAVELDLKG